jgi:hypothetical protein
MHLRLASLRFMRLLKEINERERKKERKEEEKVTTNACLKTTMCLHSFCLMFQSFDIIIVVIQPI